MIRIDAGGGKYVEIPEPERADFAANLGGAVEFSLAKIMYWTLGQAGSALGEFASGFAIRFLERIEPHFTPYLAPFIDEILDIEELPESMRVLLEGIRNPEHEVGALLSQGLTNSLMGTLSGNIMAPVLAPVAQQMNILSRAAIPEPDDAIQAWRNGDIIREDMEVILAKHGLPDWWQRVMLNLARSHAGLGEIMQAFMRGEIPEDQLQDEFERLGLTYDDQLILLSGAKTRLNDAQWIIAWRRGEIEKDQLVEELRKLGWVDDHIELLLTVNEPVPGPGDLISMAVREAFNEEVAALFGYDQDYPVEFAEHMEQLGYNPDWALRYWRSHWDLPGVSQGYELFHRGIISREELENLMRALDIPVFWREALLRGSYSTLTRVDVRRMYELGVLDREQVYREYLNYGYSPTNAERMTEFTVKYAQSDGGTATANFRDLTRTTILEAYRKGLITHEQAETRLMGLDYDQEDIDLLISLEDWDKLIADSYDPEEDFKDDIMRIVQEGYSRRIIGETDAINMLSEVGYSEQQIAYQLQSLDFWAMLDDMDAELDTVGKSYIVRATNRSNAIDRMNRLGMPSSMQEKMLERWDVQREVRDRRATEAQYRKLLLSEIIGLEEYKENLRGLGYTEYDIWVYSVNAVGAEEAGPKPTERPIV